MFPTYQAIEQPLVDELARRGGSARPRDKDKSGLSIYEALADHFGLSQAEREATIMEEGVARSRWENMVRYAVRSLRDRGILVHGGQHGVWELSETRR